MDERDYRPGPDNIYAYRLKDDKDLCRLKERYGGKHVEEIFKDFYNQYYYLNNSQIAFVFDITMDDVSNLKSTYNLSHTYICELNSSTFVHKKQKPKPRKATPIPDLDIEDEEQWIVENYGEYGICKMSEILKENGITCTERKIIRILNDHDVEINKKTTHPCNNLQWLFESYIKKQKSVNECAKEAGVSATTIYRWLSNHRIALRDREESMAD